MRRQRWIAFDPSSHAILSSHRTEEAARKAAQRLGAAVYLEPRRSHNIDVLCDEDGRPLPFMPSRRQGEKREWGPLVGARRFPAAQMMLPGMSEVSA